MVLNEINLTETINFHTVTKNMHTWYNKRNTPSEVQHFFIGVTNFDFSLIFHILDSPLGLHFYPAITDEGFVLYIIESQYDKLSIYLDDPDKFTDYIIEAKLIKEPNFVVVDSMETKIPTKEAVERIANWTSSNEEYLVNNGAEGDVFIAFNYEGTDLPLSDVTGYFGLFKTADSDSWKADIIMLSDDSFYNTVRPVPPFGQGGGSEYFLLTASLG